MNLVDQINKLKKEKNAIILAHYYQRSEIQDVADYVGDSLGLSQKAANTNADIIVFAGVHFMAETAKILNPNKKVVLPDLNTGCSLADSCPPEAFKAFINKYPQHMVITYVNCSAEIKGMSDVVCTSSNALKIVESVPKDQQIIFAPDKNLGNYINKQTNRNMILWDGSCIVHEAFNIDKLLNLYKEYPDAVIIAHPESEAHILKVASFIGSTLEMINYVKANQGETYIVGTEAGILHQMQKEAPNTKLIPIPTDENNTCACSECGYMKINTLEKLRDCLLNEQPTVEVSKNVISDALLPIRRMLELS